MMHTLTTALVSAFSFLTLTTAATSTTAAASSTSSTIDVQVGQNNQLTFSPSSVTAPQGATINFHFYPANHSVGESLVRTPCRYTRDGIWSGFVPVSSGVASTVFSVTLNDTDAHWLYSAQRDGDECQNGMVMVINPPDNPADTLDAYIKAAKIAGNSTDGFVVRGGLLVDSSSSVSSSSTVSSQTSVTVASVTSTVASGTTGTTGTTASETVVSGTSGTSASATAATTTGAATGTGTGTSTSTATGTGIGTTAASSSATTGSAASATNTGAANANGYKSSIGLGAGALLLSIWYHL